MVVKSGKSSEVRRDSNTRVSSAYIIEQYNMCPQLQWHLSSADNSTETGEPDIRVTWLWTLHLCHTCEVVAVSTGPLAMETWPQLVFRCVSQQQQYCYCLSYSSHPFPFHSQLQSLNCKCKNTLVMCNTMSSSHCVHLARFKVLCSTHF